MDKSWRSGPPSQSPGTEVLSSLYQDLEMSYANIALRYGVTKTTVSRWLQAAGIPARDLSTATSIAQKGRSLSEKHRAALVRNAAKARAAQTPDGWHAGGERLKRWVEQNGHPRAGTSWTDAERAKQMATRQTPEYRAKQSAAHKGEKSYLWRGGKTGDEALRMQGHEWRARRKECYARDNWTCQDCGVKCRNNVRIQCHHLVPRRYGGGDELENLLTLCASCHQKRERRYATAFIT